MASSGATKNNTPMTISPIPSSSVPRRLNIVVRISTASGSERGPVFQSSIIDRGRSLPLAVLIACEIARSRVETRRYRGRRRSPINGLCLRRATVAVVTPNQIAAGNDQQDRPKTVKQMRNQKIQHGKGADADQQGPE